MPFFKSPVLVALSLLITNILATNDTLLPLKARLWGTAYDTAVTIGGQSLGVRVDTGSSDLWVLTPGWTCYLGAISLTSPPLPQKDCYFGNSTYKQTDTYKSADGVWLGEHYGLGIAFGPMGYENVTIGSLSISQQEMGFANLTSLPGDGYAEGVMGLAYPPLAIVHPENVPVTVLGSALADYKDRIFYPTVVERMLKAGITYFSMALQRLPLNQEFGDGGYFAFGRLPPVDHGPFVTVPVEKFKNLPSVYTDGKDELSYWVTTVQEVTWGTKNNTVPFQVVVDSGNWVMMIPADVANAVNAEFDPPGKLVDYQGLQVMEMNCSASGPSSFGLKIGGQMFDINTADLVWRDANGTCYSSVSPAPTGYGTTLAVLGDAFLKNVVGVFDYSKNQMQFASQNSNSSSVNPSSSSAMNLNARFSTLFLAAVVVLAALI